MKRLPMPTNSTKESFGMVAGARYRPATTTRNLKETGWDVSRQMR
jgi:hypothetical protein